MTLRKTESYVLGARWLSSWIDLRNARNMVGYQMPYTAIGSQKASMPFQAKGPEWKKITRPPGWVSRATQILKKNCYRLQRTL